MRLPSARPALPFVLATLALVVVAAGPAFAATHTEEKHEGGLSFLQLHRYDLGIFTLIVFGLLVLVLHRVAWPKITEGLAKREAAIIGARDAAAAARQEAEALRVKLQKDYAEAHDKIRALLDEARKDADAHRASEKEAAARDAQAERDRARKDIEAERAAEWQLMTEQAVQLAALLSAKTIRRELNPDDHRRLLQESLDELKGGVGKA